MSRGILLLSFLFCGVFFSAMCVCTASTYTPVFDGTHIKTKTTWTKAGSPYLIEGKVTLESGSSLVIEPGVVVKFKYRKGVLEIFGDFFAVGTRRERIIFTSERDDSFGGDTNGDGDATKAAEGDWLYLNYGSSKSFGEMRYTSVLYAGYNSLGYLGSAIVISSNDNVSVTKSEIMYTRGDALLVACARPIINENIIAYNRYGIYGSCLNEFPTPKKNSIFNNFNFGARIYIPEYRPLEGKMDMTDNWWGDVSGPKYISRYGLPDNRGGLGDRITDGILFNPWLTEDPNALPPTPDPVIVIPGILGSWKKYDGQWAIDPIFHTYDNLRDEFLANGYEEGKNYFEFPYEWRDSNIVNAKLLRDKINNIKNETGRSKVDIVAHSMGGLLAREYIESNYYDGDVDQLITIGTPHLGAPKDYIKWEAGEFFGDIFERAGRSIFYLEALENGYSGIFAYIRDKIPSVKELLPIYNYLYDYDELGGNWILRKSYPNNYPRNEFLEELNRPEKVELLKNVEFTKIVGESGDDLSTISGYNVIPFNIPGLWYDGYPKYFNIPYFENQGITTSNGDKTVPIYSSEAIEIPSQDNLHLKSDHGALPTEAQKDILEILTGTRPREEIRKWHVPNLLLILVHSPVDVQIESPSGEKIGKNFETNGIYDEIEGAYYTGFDTESEFIAIPNPEEGEYKVTTQGTGKGGTFEIDVTRIEENESDPNNAIESTGTIRGATQEGEILEEKVDLSADKITALSIDSIRSSIEHYFALGYIRSREEFDYYLARIGLIEKLIDRLDEKRKNKKSSEKIQREINLHIDHLVDHIRKSGSELIDSQAAKFLIEDFEDLKNILIAN